MQRRWISIAVLALLAAACTSTMESSMNTVAESYVKLVLAVGRHDADYVDAYYGPQEWRDEVESGEPADLGGLLDTARGLIDRVAAVTPAGDDPLEPLRKDYLSTQLRAVAARIEQLQGRTFTFDEESRALYDAVAPTNGDEHFEAILAQLEPLLPGEGSLAVRYEAFRDEFVIPAEKVDVVFRAAVDACRERTVSHLQLPEGESFEIEYVSGKPWSAYNWYQGGFHSLIQVNIELPIRIDRAVDLACHEGYPGHHVYNVLLEKKLMRDRGWVEYSVYPLFSPQSLIAEGTANFGIDVAFPGEERVAFEKEVLFPLAGLDPQHAGRYYDVLEKSQALTYAGNEAARAYLDGKISAEVAVEKLRHFALMPEARARQRVAFIERYRAYVINYNLGQDIVKAWVERESAADGRVWAVFGELISSPRLPSALQ